MNWSWLVPSVKSDHRQATRYLEHLSGWPEEEVRAMQLECVRAVWADAVVDIPFYRHLVEMDKAPRTIETWEDFRSIPVMDKLTYRRHETEFVRLSGPADSYLQTAVRRVEQRGPAEPDRQTCAMD
jgi:phenylacetate-coenzyme A ligase PaaK-like adenylate-forming protein